MRDDHFQPDVIYNRVFSFGDPFTLIRIFRTDKRPGYDVRPGENGLGLLFSQGSITALPDQDALLTNRANLGHVEIFQNTNRIRRLRNLEELFE